MAAKKILVISHYAERTGAPVVLLELLRWLSQNSILVFDIVLKGGGSLLCEFESLGRTFQFKTNKIQRNLPRLVNPLGWNFDPLGHCYKTILKKSRNAGLVYSNTITNGEVLEKLSGLNCPVICHVHELEAVINKFGRRNIELVKRHTTHYIANSFAVKENLMGNHNISEDCIDVVPPFLTVDKLPEKFPNKRQELNIPENAFVVCGSGIGDAWVKGKDLFIQLALHFRKFYPKIPSHFLWVGGRNGGAEYVQLQLELKAARLSDYVSFIPAVDNPFDYFNCCDVFTLVSREESYGLVGLEAAALGKPVLCFANAGGMPEFVEENAGFIVPYVDVSAMAEKLILLARDKGLRNQLGNCAATKVRDRHDIHMAGPRVLEIINRIMAEKSDKR